MSCAFGNAVRTNSPILGKWMWARRGAMKRGAVVARVWAERSELLWAIGRWMERRPRG